MSKNPLSWTSAEVLNLVGTDQIQQVAESACMLAEAATRGGPNPIEIYVDRDERGYASFLRSVVSWERYDHPSLPEAQAHAVVLTLKRTGLEIGQILSCVPGRKRSYAHLADAAFGHRLEDACALAEEREAQVGAAVPAIRRVEASGDVSLITRNAGGLEEVIPCISKEDAQVRLIESHLERSDTTLGGFMRSQPGVDFNSFRIGAQAALGILGAKWLSVGLSEAQRDALETTIAEALEVPRRKEVVILAMREGCGYEMAAAVGSMHESLLKQGLAGVGPEEVSVLAQCGEDAAAMLDDWEARLGVDVTAAREALGRPMLLHDQQYQAILAAERFMQNQVRVLLALGDEFGAPELDCHEVKRFAHDCLKEQERGAIAGAALDDSHLVRMGACVTVLRNELIEGGLGASMPVPEVEGRDLILAASNAFNDERAWDHDPDLFRDLVKKYCEEPDFEMLGVRP
ncbi:hypothetical protein ACW0US_17685 [Xanthomonas euvesicatoria]